MTDFFISYTGTDCRWAEWIAWVLEEAGFSVVVQAWDFRPGGNFVVEMQRAATGSNRTIAVLSPDYLRSLYAMAEWTAAFAADPDGTKGKLIPVMVREATLDGLLASIIHIKLVGLDEAAAREALLKGLAPGRVRPESVRFPGVRPFPGSAMAPPDPDVAQAALSALPLEDVPEPGPLPVGSRMPLASNPLFVGREEDLKTLARQLKAGETSAVGQVQIAAATGLGGIGKTQLAVELVHRYGRFFAGGVFWMRFADSNTVSAEVAACGRSLGLLSSFEALTLEQQVRLVEEAWRSPLPRLLVFDNCEEEDLLLRWRPTFGGARVLVTSRRAEWNSTLGVKTVPLTTLPRPASIKLLRGFRPDISETEPALNGIADELGDLPLALHLAGSFLKTYRSATFAQPATYLESLRQSGLLAHPSLEGRGSGTLPTEHESHVGRTFTLSLQRLDPTNATDAIAIALLTRASWFAPGEPIPRKLLLATVLTNPEDLTAGLEAEDALRRLTDLGLVEANNRNDLLMHRLVAAWARGITKSDEAQLVVEEAILAEAERSNETKNPALLLAWQPHLRAVTDRALAREDNSAAQLCNELGSHLWQAADYPGARLYLEKAVALHKELLGTEHPLTAKSLNSFGLLLHSQGDYPTASSFYEQGLAIRERVLGLEHPDTAHSLNDLGNLLADQGDYGGARLCHERALAIRERVLGSEHPNTAYSLNNLGSLLRAQEDYTGARSYFERALAILERFLGPDHPDTAGGVNNLGSLLLRVGDYAEAQPYLERALAICEKTLGLEHPHTADSLSNLGATILSQGDYTAARFCYERALAIREKALGSEHPDTASSLLHLGSLYFNQKNFGRARWYLEKALDIFKARLGSEHPKAKNTRRHLSLLPGARRLKKNRPKNKA